MGVDHERARGPDHERASGRVRWSFPVAFAVTVSLVALGAVACGDESEPTSTAATEAQSSTTTTAQSSTPDTTEFLDATLAPTTAGEPGVVVQSVEPGSLTRLRQGDVIVAVDGRPVASPSELISAVGTPEIGEEFTIRVVRGANRLTLAVSPSPTAYLGANVKDLNRVKGAVVVSIAAKSPAASTELQPGDVITALDDSPVGSVKDLLQSIGTHEAGDRIEISFSRGSRQLKVAATLAARPAPGAGQ